MSTLTFAKAINSSIDLAMSIDESVICYGLGVTDPKNIFGTTSGLEEKYGGKRVFDMPTSENAMTGVAIGASMTGVKPLITHQRLDFFLLALDQLVNSAAKMHYMFGGNVNIPITIRLIIGRGWGQGPTHSQNLQSWFAHIPGLKVVMPSSPKDAKGLLLSSIFDPNPVVFLEHRWLHNTIGEVPDEDYRIKIGTSKTIIQGNDITIVSMSYMTMEALIAEKYLRSKGIFIELIDLRSIKPLDIQSIENSVKKTGKLLVLDTGVSMCSVSSEIIAQISITNFNHLSSPPSQLAMPNVPEPTSFGLTKNFYIRAADIANRVFNILGVKGVDASDEIPEPTPHDVPGDWFKGPF